MELFDRNKLEVLPLSNRKSKSNILDIAIDPNSKIEKSKSYETIEKISREIIKARSNNKPIILAYGAHLIKNGLGPLLRKMIEYGYITHLATNGAGSIHDWEIAFQGKTEEDVKEYVSKGQFGIWEETGKFINLAIISGALRNKGYGESICEMINEQKLFFPKNNNSRLKAAGINKEILEVVHDFKEFSVQDAAYRKGIPFTVHPGFGYDIIYTHPLSDGESIGKVSEIDFLKFVQSISHLEGGLYLSVGSAIMSPMIFEKSLSMARNIARQKGEKIQDFMIVVNDIQEGDWNWNSNIEPLKEDPAYYLRFCKTFNRMGAREMYYIQESNKTFLLNLYQNLRTLE